MAQLFMYNGTDWVSVADTSAWGSIAGTLADQTDLKEALDAKVATSTTVAGKPLTGNITLEPADIGMEIVDTWQE